MHLLLQIPKVQVYTRHKILRRRIDLHPCFDRCFSYRLMHFRKQPDPTTLSFLFILEIWRNKLLDKVGGYMHVGLFWPPFEGNNGAGEETRKAAAPVAENVTVRG